MLQNQSNSQCSTSLAVDKARVKWVSASEAASKLATELFRRGYGAPEALMEAKHHLQTARHEAERLFREYYDLSRQETEQKMLGLQKSQKLATWASFAVAAMVGVATIIGTEVTLLKH
jgi:hypothetical protein